MDENKQNFYLTSEDFVNEATVCAEDFGGTVLQSGTLTIQDGTVFADDTAELYNETLEVFTLEVKAWFCGDSGNTSYIDSGVDEILQGIGILHSYPSSSRPGLYLVSDSSTNERGMLNNVSKEIVYTGHFAKVLANTREE